MFVIPILLIALAGAQTPTAAQAGEGALQVAPCSIPGMQGQARCGTFQVWENRETKSGRKIGIYFVVLPATGVAKATEAIAFFAGGPGQAATESAAGVAQELAAVRDTRDILLVDGRGTGKSNPLPCEISRPTDLQSYLVEFFTPDGVARCAEQLKDRADVRWYDSAPTADDLEELRAALGYQQLDLYGGSYGTRTAMVYLRRHPEHVRLVLAEGPVPVDTRTPLYTARDAQQALDGVLADCRADAACHAAFPDPAADLRAAFARLEQGPAEATLVSPLTGEAATVHLSGERLAEALRYMTYDPAVAPLIPAVLRHAARGDFGPAAEQALFWRRGLVSQSSRGLYLAVTCPEDVDFADSAQAAELSRGTFLGMARWRDQKAACAVWPHRTLGHDFVETVRSDVPVLITSGQADPATPAHHGERMLAGLPNGRLLVIPHAGHWAGGLVGGEECETRIAAEFIRTANAKTVDASCLAGIRRWGFPTDVHSGGPVAVDSATLAQYAGTYAAGPMQATLRMQGRTLHYDFMGQDEPLVAIGPGRFRPVSQPNILLTFTGSGAGTQFQAQWAAGPPDTFRRTGP
ncbi:MAG: alpha/beta fold hydrolase [Gemmatimonadetes bacterium]|nr:alpha/beta fold hydrolase [Gemmatimonadota bacterium]